MPIPTLQNIADALGMAKSTVSYALRDSPKVPAETKKKIVDTATRMGYKPNPLVGAFMSHLRATRPASYQATLAWATSHSSEEGWRENPAAVGFYEGARLRCEQRGYRLEKLWLRQPGISIARRSKILESRGIRGVLVNSLPGNSRGHFSLDLTKLAAVTMGYSVSRPNIDRVACDNYRGTLTLLHEARKHGYRRIGAIFSRTLDRRLEYLLTAAVRAHADMPGHQEIALLKVDWDTDNYSRISRWLDEEKPDFIMGEAPGVADIVRRTGRKIPADIGFAVFSYPDERVCAGLNQNHEMVGCHAADLLISKLQMNEYGIPTHPRILLVQADWVDGPSLRQIPSRR